MLSTRHTVGGIYTGENMIEITPRIAPLPVMPGVAFVHGAGSTATYITEPYGRQSQKTMRVGSRYPAVAGDNGGVQTWGNNLAVTRLGGYLAALAARPDASDDYALIGDSMGGIVSLNYAAQATRKPKAIVLTIPVMNPEDIRANNRSGYAALLNAAYGGTYSEATLGATKNPHTMRAAAKLKSIPMLIFYGANDTLCLPQFVTEFAAADPSFRTAVSLPFGHEVADYAATDHERILTFLQTHLGV